MGSIIEIKNFHFGFKRDLNKVNSITLGTLNSV